MSGDIAGYTPNYGLRLIDFSAVAWHKHLWYNLRLIDSLLLAATGIAGLLGVWQLSTTYVVGQRVTDESTGVLYQCTTGHTSASSGTFEADRTANPTYWAEINSTPTARGAWVTATYYNPNDYVIDSEKYYVAHTGHTSTTSIAADIANWTLLIDVADYVTIDTAETITGAKTFSNAINIKGAILADNHPVFEIIENDGAADEKGWRYVMTAGSYSLRALNDAKSATNPARTIERTGYAVDSWTWYITGSDALLLDSSGLSIAGDAFWHAGNMGAASGLDADLLDGQEGAYYADINARLGYTAANDADLTQEISDRTTADALKLNLTGGTLTGALTLNGAPSVDLHAATKKYVDDLLAARIEPMYIPARDISPAQSNGCAALSTTAGGGTNADIEGLNFDATAVEYAQLTVIVPPNAGATFDIQFYWRSLATDTDVCVWQAEAITIGDGDLLTDNFGTAVHIDDAAQSAAGKCYITDALTVTPANTPAEGDYVVIRISRLATDAADTMTEDGRLLGVLVQF